MSVCCLVRGLEEELGESIWDNLIGGTLEEDLFKRDRGRVAIWTGLFVFIIFILAQSKIPINCNHRIYETLNVEFVAKFNTLTKVFRCTYYLAYSSVFISEIFWYNWSENICSKNNCLAVDHLYSKSTSQMHFPSSQLGHL